MAEKKKPGRPKKIPPTRMELVESVLKKAQRISDDRYCPITSNPYADYSDWQNQLTIDLKSMIRDATLKEKETIWCYCVDRVFRTYKLFDASKWKRETYKGYYDEIYSQMTLLEEPAQNIIQALAEIDKLNDVDKIKQCLELEYGYLIGLLEHASVASVVSGVSSDKLFLSETYMKKINRDDLNIYKGYTLPHAICINRRGPGWLKIIDGYSVIDGYHRVLSAQKNGTETVSIILLE